MSKTKKVYLIKSIENSNYKIGTSIHPLKRLAENQTGNENELILVNTYESEFATKIETTLHNLYASDRKKGEWFNLSLLEEQNFVKNCMKFEKNFVLLKNNAIYL